MLFCGLLWFRSVDLSLWNDTRFHSNELLTLNNLWTYHHNIFQLFLLLAWFLFPMSWSFLHAALPLEQRRVRILHDPCMLFIIVMEEWIFALCTVRLLGGPCWILVSLSLSLLKEFSTFRFHISTSDLQKVLSSVL